MKRQPGFNMCLRLLGMQWDVWRYTHERHWLRGRGV